ncbi:MAG: V-type ATP synthase subunit F [bacterium]|nr:V-type ATP synthase subunit F [bacterium]
MQMYLISDNVDTYTGMRLAGVDGVVIHSKKHLRQQLEKVMANKEIGIVLITEKLSSEFPDIINEIKLNRRLPLIVEIPDRHGTGRNPDFITSYVSEAIGLKL